MSNAEMMSDAEVAEFLDCETETVQRNAIDGKLPGLKFGRSWLFPRSALMEALHVLALARVRALPPTPATTGFKVVHQPQARPRRRSGPPPALPNL